MRIKLTADGDGQVVGVQHLQSSWHGPVRVFVVVDSTVSTFDHMPTSMISSSLPIDVIRVDVLTHPTLTTTIVWQPVPIPSPMLLSHRGDGDDGLHVPVAAVLVVVISAAIGSGLIHFPPRVGTSRRRV